jgi:hypothetical protein
VIGDIRFADEGNGNDFLSLVVIERLKDETVKVFDVDGRAAGRAGGLSGTFGQEVSWVALAIRNNANA